MINESGLTKCPNPRHYICIGRLNLSLQIAQDYWAKVEPSGNIVRYYFSFYAIQGKQTNLTLYTIILFKWHIGIAYI